MIRKAMTTRFAIAAMLGAVGMMMVACSSSDHHHTKAKAQKDIVDTAVSAGSFNTLVTAVQTAGLVDTLKSEGPYTVFAPTDAAFAKLPPGTVDNLLQNPDKLRSILLYHVVPGNVMAADVVKLRSAKTAQGQMVAISTANGVMVDNAHVVQTDIVASNGVIHVIDTVILPN